MAVEFKLPELGENISSGDVTKVLVRPGEAIGPNQAVLEIETDKAVVEIPCPYAGKVAGIHVKEGDTVKVGQLLLTLEGEQQPASPAAQRPKPQTADSMAAPSAACVSLRPEEPPESPIAQPTKPPEGRTAAAEPAIDTGGPIPAGPAARRIARELGVDLRQVQGTGLRGRITPEDVRAAAKAMGSGQAVAAPGGLAPAPFLEPVVPPGEPGEDAWGPIRREKLSQIRRTIAARMSLSASTIPHVTNFDDADITELENVRKGVPQGYLGPDLKLTTMPFVMRAVALALRRHPALNATLDEQNQQIVYKQYVNLGIAVDTPRGLVVPVVRNADRMTILELVRALASVAKRARTAQFAIEELRGGTFTISNLGAVGGTYSTPIINYPEVALLLVGRSRWLPVVREGRIEPRYMLPLSLSYDHRLVDGAAAGRFLNELIDLLQSPGKLLLAG